MSHSIPTPDAPFGFLNLYKSAKRTSNHTGLDVRRLLQNHYRMSGKKNDRLTVGHIGTLDPDAEGVLPIAIGKATRLIQFIDHSQKIYSFTLVFGKATTTGDASGEEKETAPIPADCLARVQGVLPKFHGPQQQIPPMYSALHHQGKRLYEIAREGGEVERAPRNFEIFSLEILSRDIAEPEGEHVPAARIRMRVHCSEGTYVRSLSEDIAKAVGSVGHMDELLREQSGPFVLAKACRMADVVKRAKTLIMDPREVITLPEIKLDEAEYKSFCNGMHVSVADRSDDFRKIFVVVDHPGAKKYQTRIVGVGIVEEGMLIPYVVFA